jgi:hypothetical protein
VEEFDPPTGGGSWVPAGDCEACDLYTKHSAN